MLVLLPPSEGKTAPRRGRPLDPSRLSFAELAAPRAQVGDALVAASARPDALEVLGVGASLAAEVEHNTRLTCAPTAPAGEVFTGVLYDALDWAGLSPAGRRRANRWCVVVSALFGAVRLSDRIPAHRLAMGTNLPGVGPLAAFWRPVLTPAVVAAAGTGPVVDARSSTYVAAAPAPRELADRWVEVHVPGATHMAKHTRGLVARQLCEHAATPRSARAVAEVVAAGRFDVDLTRPSPTRPWRLSVTAHE